MIDAPGVIRILDANPHPYVVWPWQSPHGIPNFQLAFWLEHLVGVLGRIPHDLEHFLRKLIGTSSWKMSDMLLTNIIRPTFHLRGTASAVSSSVMRPFHLARPPETRVVFSYFFCPMAAKRAAIRIA